MPKKPNRFNFSEYLKTLNSKSTTLKKQNKIPLPKKKLRPKKIKPVKNIISQMPPIINIPNTQIHILRSIPTNDLINHCKKRKIQKLFTIVRYSPEDQQRILNAGIMIFPLVKTKISSGNQKIAGFEEFYQTVKSEKAPFAIQCFGGRHASRQFATYYLLREGMPATEVLNRLKLSNSSPEDLIIIKKGVEKYLENRINQLRAKTKHKSKRNYV